MHDGTVLTASESLKQGPARCKKSIPNEPIDRQVVAAKRVAEIAEVLAARIKSGWQILPKKGP
jgi:hypothetical protein